MTFSQPSWSLRQSLIAVYLFGTLFMLSGMILVVKDRLSSYFTEDLITYGQAVAERLASDARLPLELKKRESAQSLLDAIRPYPNVASLYLRSIDGEIIASIGIPASSMRPMQSISEQTRFLNEPDQIVLKTEVRSSVENHSDSFGLQFDGQATTSPQKTGEIELVLSKNNLEKMLHRINEYILLILMSGMTGLVIILVVFLRKLTKPIKELALAMNNPVSLTEFRPVEVQGVRESRYIGHAFNTLMAKLQKNHLQLLETNTENERLNRKLTQTVHEQVAELEAQKAELKTQNIQLEEAHRQAQVGSDAKSQFIAQMSHEIRTPLHGMIGPLSLLQKTALTDRQKSFLLMIQESAQRLLREMEAILEFSKLEAHQFKLNEAPCDVRAVLQNTLILFTERAQAKKLAVHLVLEPNQPLWVYTDASRIERIVSVLLDNAIKFTAQGQITIKASYKNRPNGRVHLYLQVEDTGIGITQEDQAIIFEQFIQADSSTTRRYGGSGLGLSIAKQSVELLHGKIRVVSQSGLGACFQLVLPLVTCSSPPATLDSKSENAASAPLDSLPPQPRISQDEPISERPKVVNFRGGARVLVVDDDQTSRLFAQFSIMGMNAEAVTVTNGEDALMACAQQSFDLILMDIRMSDMDGLEATRQIRQITGPNQHTPIIGLTGDALKFEKQDWQAAGMNEVYQKPLTDDRLIEVFEKWRKRPSKERPLAAFLRDRSRGR